VQQIEKGKVSPGSWVTDHTFTGTENTEFKAFITTETDLGNGVRQINLQFAPPANNRLFIRLLVEEL